LFGAEGRRSIGIGPTIHACSAVRPENERVAFAGCVHPKTGGSLGASDEELEHERQTAVNQALRRDVNERRLERSDEDEIEFVCECTDPACAAVVSLTVDECEFIRSVPTRLVVTLGHANHATERVLMEEPGRFQVVEKFGPSGDVIAHLDPRGLNRRGSIR
jgi:hypothetical protein